MGKGPKWFQAIPKWAQDAIEQVGHFWMGVAARLAVVGDLWWWWRESIKQWPPGDTVWVNKKTLDVQTMEPTADVIADGYKPYAPHDRIWDTFVDTLFATIGGVVVNLTVVGLVAWWIVRLYKHIEKLEELLK